MDTPLLVPLLATCRRMKNLVYSRNITFTSDSVACSIRNVRALQMAGGHRVSLIERIKLTAVFFFFFSPPSGNLGKIISIYISDTFLYLIKIPSNPSIVELCIYLVWFSTLRRDRDIQIYSPCLFPYNHGCQSPQGLLPVLFVPDYHCGIS